MIFREGNDMNGKIGDKKNLKKTKRKKTQNMVEKGKRRNYVTQYILNCS